MIVDDDIIHLIRVVIQHWLTRIMCDLSFFIAVDVRVDGEPVRVELCDTAGKVR